MSLSTSNPNIATLLGAPRPSAGEKITANGWIRTARKQKRITFLELGDGSTPETLQVVLNPAQAEGYKTWATRCKHNL